MLVVRRLGRSLKDLVAIFSYIEDPGRRRPVGPGREYPWGGPWEDGLCNTHEAGLGRTSPAGLFPRARQKGFGIEDLAGNVWEWCLNKYDKPEDTTIDDSGDFRVVRGGSWFNLLDGARTARRYDYHPDARDDFGGFRLVCLSPIR